MGRRNREIEKKFLIHGTRYDEAVLALMKVLKHSNSIENSSTDYYWHAPQGLKADFVRLRLMPEGYGQITAKFADGENNVDRVEIDVRVDDPLQAKRFLNFTMGRYTGKVAKKYFVFFMGSQHDNVSVYQVEGDDRVFLEVEASSLELVDKIVEQCGMHLIFQQENRSLYQIFVKKEEV